MPSYAGTLYLYLTDGKITLLNELRLEDYLCGVVSSEMPSDYPEEAQKAQAVCARTYAVNQMTKKRKLQEENEILQEDLNDSVDFQVYNNYRSSDASSRAVQETSGEILPLEEVLYYSTSCLSEHREDLGSDDAFSAFLSEPVPEEAEYNSPWIRWKAVIPEEQLLENLRQQYQFQAEKAETVQVQKRRGDGQVTELRIKCGEQSIVLEGEYQIRKALGGSGTETVLCDGTEAPVMQLLPSGYFCILDEFGEDRKISLSGGGYGHGCGMSQCGAAALADAGGDYLDILGYYYGERELIHVKDL